MLIPNACSGNLVHPFGFVREFWLHFPPTRNYFMHLSMFQKTRNIEFPHANTEKLAPFSVVLAPKLARLIGFLPVPTPFRPFFR